MGDSALSKDLHTFVLFVHVTLVIIKAETWNLTQSSFPVTPLGTQHLQHQIWLCTQHTTFWAPQFKRYHPWSMRWNSALLNVLQMHLVLVVHTDVRTPCIRTCRWHRPTAQHQLIPQIVCTSCDWCHWSTHHAEDPSWSLLNIRILESMLAVFAAAGVVTALGATELAEELGTSSTACTYPCQHSLALCPQFPTRSAVALETGILQLVSRLFLVFFLCLSFLFLFLSHCLCCNRSSCCVRYFCRTFPNFCQIFLCHSSSCICLLSCPSLLRLPSALDHDHHPQLPGNSSMPFEELRNLLDSELASTFLLVLVILDNTIAHFSLSLNTSPVAFWKSTIWFSHFNSLFLNPSVVPKSYSRRFVYSCNDVPVVAPYSLLSLRQLSKPRLWVTVFHQIQSLVLAHHGQTHVQRFVRLSAFRDCLRQAPQVHSLLGPTIPQLCRRGNQTSYEIPTRSAAILVCLQRNLKACQTTSDPLSLTDCQRA